MAAAVVGARPAAAVAPCFEVCHLGQGQPLLLVDVDVLWVRRCATARPGAAAVCVLERVDLRGRVLERVPHERSYDDEAFEKAHLRGHTLAGLHHQSAWTDLTKPYTVAPSGARSSTLRIERGALVCAPASATAPAIRRPFGCAPRSVYVFAAGLAPDGKPRDPKGTVAVVATCADGPGTREAVAICQPAR